MKNATEQQACKVAAVFTEHHKVLAGNAPSQEVQWAIQNGPEFVLLVAQALQLQAQQKIKKEQFDLDWNEPGDGGNGSTLVEAEAVLTCMNQFLFQKGKWRFPKSEELKLFLQNGFGKFTSVTSYWLGRNTKDAGWLGRVFYIGEELVFDSNSTAHEHNKHKMIFVKERE